MNIWTTWISRNEVPIAHILAGLLASMLLLMASLLVPPIIWPSVLHYPWKYPESSSERNKDKKKVVVLAGSYNPPHYGHLVMLDYLASRYGQVIAVVGMNPDKKYLVTPEERAGLIRKMLSNSKHKDNVRVEVVSGLIWRFAKRQGATIFFRGIRSWEKDGKEERSLQILNTWGPLLLGPTWPLPTVYLEGKPEYNRVSSTLVRTLCRDGRPPTETLHQLVPDHVADEVAKLYNRKQQ